MTNRKPWTPAENLCLVSLYFAMLDKATNGKPYIKAHMITAAQVQGDLAGTKLERSRASIEFKLMNATAAHADLRPLQETMHGHGYRAMPNYQATLREAMAERLDARDAVAAARDHVEGAA